MTPEELTRDEMEEQLRAGVFDEPQEEAPEEEDAEARGAEPHEEGDQEPPEPPSMEELQERLTKLEEELGHKTGALAEERDRRRTVEGQHAMLMEAIQQARERAGQQPQTQQQEVHDESLEEYQDYLDAVEKKFGPVVRQIYERQQQMEQYLAQQYQAQNQVQTFAQESQRFAQEKADYNDALQFLVDKARKRATLFTQDPEQINYAVAQAAQQLMYYQPAQLYQLAQVEGYSPRQEKAQAQTDTQRQQPRKQPKSLGAIPGATGNLPDSFQTKAQRVVDASFRDLEKIPVEELDALLKSMG